MVGFDSKLIDDLRGAINAKRAVLLKQVFEAEKVGKMKLDFFALIQKMEESNPTIDNSCPNFLRRDINPEKSAVKRTKQMVTSFYWNEPFDEEQNYMKAMSRFKNKVAQLPDNFATDLIEDDGFLTYANISHYPVGGGHLNKHQDPPNKQFCVIIASLSTRSEDFQTGGLYFYYKDKKVDLDGMIEAGDVYLMNPQSIHGIDPIVDGYDQPRFDMVQGRWIMFPTLIELKTTKGIKVEGLKDLGQD